MCDGDVLRGANRYRLSPSYPISGTFLCLPDLLVAVRDIVPALLSLDGYAVKQMPTIRSGPDMLACFVNARRFAASSVSSS